MLTLRFEGEGEAGLVSSSAVPPLPTLKVTPRNGEERQTGSSAVFSLCLLPVSPSFPVFSSSSTGGFPPSSSLLALLLERSRDVTAGERVPDAPAPLV